MSHRLTLLTVNGHPDDETVTAGATMARYAAEGIRVVCVTATRGEVGEIVAPDLDAPDSYARLGEIREGEMVRALRRLGTIEHHFLDYRDSGMMGTPANLDPRSFWQADIDEATDRLVRIVRTVEPDVIVAPNAFGGDGHPDHIRAGEIARLAFERSGDRTAYPGQLIRDGLQPWEPRKLYESVNQFGRREKLLRALAAGGPVGTLSMILRVARHWNPRRERGRARMAAAQGPVTTRIDVRKYIDAKHAAMREHRTQIAPDADLFALRPNERQKISPTEDFTLRAARCAVTTPEDDLFAGLR